MNLWKTSGFIGSSVNKLLIHNVRNFGKNFLLSHDENWGSPIKGV